MLLRVSDGLSNLSSSELQMRAWRQSFCFSTALHAPFQASKSPFRAPLTAICQRRPLSKALTRAFESTRLPSRPWKALRWSAERAVVQHLRRSQALAAALKAQGSAASRRLQGHRWPEARAMACLVAAKGNCRAMRQERHLEKALASS